MLLSVAKSKKQEMEGVISSSRHPFDETEHIRWLSITSIGTEIQKPSGPSAEFMDLIRLVFHSDRLDFGRVVDGFLWHVQDLSSSLRNRLNTKISMSQMEMKTGF